MVLKKILITLTIVLFLIGCAKQPVQEPTPTPPATVEAVEDVGTGISDINDIDKELDTSELDEIDTMLEDIENI